MKVTLYTLYTIIIIQFQSSFIRTIIDIVSIVIWFNVYKQKFDVSPSVFYEFTFCFFGWVWGTYISLQIKFRLCETLITCITHTSPRTLQIYWTANCNFSFATAHMQNKHLFGTEILIKNSCLTVWSHQIFAARKAHVVDLLQCDINFSLSWRRKLHRIVILDFVRALEGQFENNNFQRIIYTS